MVAGRATPASEKCWLFCQTGEVLQSAIAGTPRRRTANCLSSGWKMLDDDDGGPDGVCCCCPSRHQVTSSSQDREHASTVMSPRGGAASRCSCCNAAFGPMVVAKVLFRSGKKCARTAASRRYLL